jgi:hypothetical protein
VHVQRATVEVTAIETAAQGRYLECEWLDATGTAQFCEAPWHGMSQNCAAPAGALTIEATYPLG